MVINILIINVINWKKGRVHMKKINLEATDVNVLNAIAKDTLQRTSDIIDFIKMLETVDYNAFIALNGKWGEGKTFFIREVEMTLKYHYAKAFEHEISNEVNSSFEANTALGNDLQLQKTYYPIYFNAWLYDNHVDALMALLLVMIKQSDENIDTTLEPDRGEGLATILDSIQFWKCSNWNDLRQSLSGNNILSETYLLEEIREKIKGVFDEIINERTDKLVVIIDELDRCRPSFSVEILESIKHYFNDDRIIFIMAVNKTQLVHTISHCYGIGFDSSNYLNKFFDINIQLPDVDATDYYNELNISCNDSYWIKKIANELQKKYHLSLRDTSIYFQKINIIHGRYGNRLGIGAWKLIALLIPILSIFEIIDVTKKQQILDGNGFDILKEIIISSDEIKKYLKIFNIQEQAGNNYTNTLIELEKVYHFAFNSNDRSSWYDGQIEIYSDFKRECIRICNQA